MKHFPLLLVISLFFISCSQNVNEVVDVKYSLILDFNTDSALPKQRLSVFVQSSGEVRRYESMKLFSALKNYEWTVNDLVMFQNNTLNFAGYSNFIVPEGQNFPSGNYQITMVNSDGDLNESLFNLNYNESLLNETVESINLKCEENNFISNIAIYDKEDKLIYFGIKTEELKTSRDIWIQYKQAKFYYDIWINQDEKMMFILPKQEIINGDNDE